MWKIQHNGWYAGRSLAAIIVNSDGGYWDGDSWEETEQQLALTESADYPGKYELEVTGMDDEGLLEVTIVDTDDDDRFQGGGEVFIWGGIEVSPSTDANGNALATATVADALRAILGGKARMHVSQVVTITDGAGGTFTLTYKGQTTSSIAYDASAATVQTALQALSTIGSGNATVTGSDGGPYTVTLGGTLDLDNLAKLTATSSVTPSTATVTIATTGRFYDTDGTTLLATVTYGQIDGSRTGAVFA